MKALPIALILAASAHAQSPATVSRSWENAVVPVEAVGESHKEEPLRLMQPGSLALTFGDPSPSWIGVSGGYQFNSTLQVLVSGGWFWSDDIRIKSVAGTARFHILPTDLTPFVGAGLAVYFMSGHGKFQGLETTTWALPFLTLGLDWIFDFGLRVAAGVNFHFPVKLTFPFINVGISF